MTTNSDDVLRALRGQAWERAKGELRAVGMTFFGLSNANEGQFDEFTSAVDRFIEHVESNGLAE